MTPSVKDRLKRAGAVYSPKLAEAWLPALLIFVAVAVARFGRVASFAWANVAWPQASIADPNLWPDGIDRHMLMLASNWGGRFDTRPVLIIVGVCLLAFAYLLFASRARFFIAGSSLLAGRFGVTVVDAFSIDIPLANGRSIFMNIQRATDWRTDLALFGIAAFLFWLDHKRRPPK